MAADPRLLLRALTLLEQHEVVPDMVISSEVGSAVVAPSGSDLASILAPLDAEATVTIAPARALLCLVGAGLARDGALRGRVLETLAALEPEGVALGGSGTSAAAVLPDTRLDDAVRAVHARFFATGASA
jgi:aspartate kinase